MQPRLQSRIRTASAVVVVSSLVVLARALPVDRALDGLSELAAGLGAWGPVVYGAVYVAAALAFVPGSVLTLAAGALFGLAVGTLTVWLAATTTAGLAFVIARYAARDRVAALAARWPRFGAVDRAIGQGGWRVIALLRLSPAIPFSLGNYLFGLTRVRLVPYLLASAAMLPGSFLYVYLGHAGRAAAAGSARTPGEWALLVVGLAATIAVTVYVTRLARRALRERAEAPVVADPSAPPASPRRTLALALAALVLAGAATYALARPAPTQPSAASSPVSGAP